MRRRQFLAAAPAVALGTAGCLTPSDSPSRPRARLHAVWFVNDSDEACDVSVAVTDGDGETVYETSFRLGAAGGDGPPANVSREPPLDDPDAYTVEATVCDETATVDTTKWASAGENCVTAKFVRTTRGDVRVAPQTYENC
ncbi:hypothetical protein [Halobacterium litoreum]|uniref:Tat (Twin-arginine translocation) pathway signal sequence n=1 Tax=Halobacterium litoreum TaxID=2039234 RepID=A0ABD5NE54_9EURY|nr:hypothetical protein [Halobacterium litoreum]UHH13739.1 hypothetical protein LT972_01780 [Halobacterium litoreum]